jgi:hypothetical protein
MSGEMPLYCGRKKAWRAVGPCSNLPETLKVLANKWSRMTELQANLIDQLAVMQELRARLRSSKQELQRSYKRYSANK